MSARTATATRRPAPPPAVAPRPGKPSPRRAGRAADGIRTYPAALRFLATLADVERRRVVRPDPATFDLGRMRDLMRRLGDPHTRLRCVHVAGTKGKGSTCLILDALLRANGHRVGLYTSPHLHDLRERIRVNGHDVPKAALIRHLARIAPHVRAMADEGGAAARPSHFDVLTAAAFLHFDQADLDLAVIEVGLGGRVDSTNVLTPLLSLITPISLDHCGVLGNTVGEIARAKAGILKPGVPAISAPHDPEHHAEIAAVLRGVAAEVGADLQVCGEDLGFSVRYGADDRAGGRPRNLLCLDAGTTRLEHHPVGLFGEHQAVNAGLALAALDRLRGVGVAADDGKSLAALGSVRLPGRLEVVRPRGGPPVVLDVAHNPAGMAAMLRGLGQALGPRAGGTLVLVLGLLADKDTAALLAEAARGADKAVFVRPPTGRAADPAELAADYAERHGKWAQVAADLPAALDLARRAAGPDGAVVVAGCFPLVGAARRLLAGSARPL